MYKITYLCYNCMYEWNEENDCACDSECPMCNARNVEACEYEEIEDEYEN